MFCGDDGEPTGGSDTSDGSGGVDYSDYQCTQQDIVQSPGICRIGCTGPRSQNCTRCKADQRHCGQVVDYDYSDCLEFMRQRAISNCLNHQWPDGAYANVSEESVCDPVGPGGKPHCYIDHEPDWLCVSAWTTNQGGTHQVIGNYATARNWASEFQQQFSQFGFRLGATDGGGLTVTRGNNTIDTFNVTQGLNGVCNSMERVASAKCLEKYSCGSVCVDPDAPPSGGGGRQ